MNNSELLGQLEVLRHTLLRIATVTLSATVPGYFMADEVIRFFIRHISGSTPVQLHYFSAMEVFTTQLKTGFFLAFFMVFPYNFLQVWRFISPGLYHQEKSRLFAYTFFSMILFILGASINILFITPMVIEFSLSFASANIIPLLGLSAIIELAWWMTLISGIFFQIPLITIILCSTKIIKPSSLRRLRPWVITVILILAAIFSPPDPLSMLLLALPGWLLFEASCLFIMRRL